MLFALLKAALQEQEPEVSLFEQATENDWKECSRLSTQQGVVIMAWDGIVRLPSSLQPPQELKIAWALAVEKYERKYQHYCEVVCRLSAYYRQYDIQTLQLKGVGFSTLYPVPSHREGGDIDIYTYSASPEKQTDQEANDLANRLVEQHGGSVEYDRWEKHSLFIYRGIPVENHRYFLDIERSKLAQQMDQFLKDRLCPQSVELLPGKHILIPDPAFNTLFIAFHTIQHFGYGLAIHHLCDWACILKHFGLQLPAELTDTRFLEGIAAMTELCNRYLGTCVPVSGGEKLAEEMMYEMLYPFDVEAYPKSTPWDFLKFKVKRFIYTVKVKNRILYTPLWRNPVFWNKIKKTIVWHLRSPKRMISQTKEE